MIFLVSLIFSALSHQAFARDAARDDAQVVSAVLAQTVRREVDKLLARGLARRAANTRIDLLTRASSRRPEGSRTPVRAGIRDQRIHDTGSEIPDQGSGIRDPGIQNSGFDVVAVPPFLCFSNHASR
jgi:hypothetical protein